MRLFFAIDLPAEVRGALGGLRVDAADYRWVDPTSMHVTLAFLGEQQADRIDALERIGAAAARASRPGTLSLSAAGGFGGKRTPRVLWVGLAGDVDALRALQTTLNDGLRSERFPVEDRAFSPHITLARRRLWAAGGPPSGWPPPVEPHPFGMNTLTLFESRLSPRGATYLPIRQFAIGS